MKIIVVTVDSNRYFSDYQCEYLPIFNKVFGVYKTLEEARSKVWDYFTNVFKDRYEPYFEETDEAYDDAFIYRDKTYNYGAYAIYGINYYEEQL